MHKYTDLEKAFMRDFIPGHTYKEIQEAFIKKFNSGISQSARLRVTWQTIR